MNAQVQVDMLDAAGPAAAPWEEPRQDAANASTMPSVVLAGPNDPPAAEVADEVVDRAEIVGGKTLIKLSRSEKMVSDLRTARAALTLSMATTKEATAVRAFRALCVKSRTTIAATALELRRPAIDFGKKVSAAEKVQIDQILTMEKEADDVIKADEKRREDERIAKEKAEAERKQQVDNDIEEIRSRVAACVDQPAAFIAETLQWLDHTEITEEDFGDRAGEALQALRQTREQVAAMHARAEVKEQAEAEAKLERERLQRLQRLAADLEAREAALARREGIAKRIDDMRLLPTTHIESDSETLRAVLDGLFNLDPAEFDARASEATAVAQAVSAELDALLQEALAEEAAARELAAPEAVVEPVVVAEAEPAAPPPPPAPIAPPPPAQPAYRVASAPMRPSRPSDGVIVSTLAKHFNATEADVLTWLKTMNFDAQAERIARGL